MKRVISLIMALALCFGLCACGASSGSQFVGKYEFESSDFELYNGNMGTFISFKETMILESGGTGTFKKTATSAGKYYQVGDIMAEGTVKWMFEENYITITFSGFSYSKNYGKNETTQIDHTSTYEKKAGTLHDTSINKTYIKIS